MKSNAVIGWLQLVLVVGVVLVAFGLTRLLQAQKEVAQQRPKETRGLYVITAEVSPGAYRLRFTTTGTVQAKAQVVVVPQVAGRVVDVMDGFYAGGTFSADQQLFQIDQRDYAFQVDLREAEVARAETALQLEQAEAEAALSEWHRLNGDKAAPDLVARVPQLAQARANLKAAKAQLDNARLNLERTSFSLPFAGRVLATDLAAGQYVAPGQPYGQVFDVASLEVEVSLSQEQLRLLLAAKEPKIEVTVDFTGAPQTYVAYLKRGAAALDPATRFAKVRLAFEAVPDGLMPGVFVDVTVVGEAVTGVTEVPASALQKDGSLWFVRADDTLGRLEPKVIDVRGDTLAVRGIEGRLRLVTNRISGATEGTQAILNGNGDAADAAQVGAE